ncbi:MAG: CPBP family intramembrane metalloprotease [Bacillota bacterium]|nr:CPBP family intramembrane metalloprotease [Bacillota bacterium]
MLQLERITPQSSKKIMGILSILLIFISIFIISYIVFQYSNQFIPQRYSALISISSHVPMLMIPWILIVIKSKTFFPQYLCCSLTKRNIRSLLLICCWLIPLQALGNVDVLGKPMPNWYVYGPVSIGLQIFFQGFFVGLSEEMLMRPFIHRTLQQMVPSNFRIIKWNCSLSLIITSLLFGFLHLGNLGHQSIEYTIFQVIYAIIIGLIIGIYYEKTKSFLGTVILHNSIDFTGVIMVFIANGFQ